VPVYSVMRVFARAGRLIGDRTFGLEVGQRMSHRGYGLWAEHSILGATLGQALRRNTSTVWALQTQCRHELLDQGEYIVWRYTSPKLDAKNHHHTDHVMTPMLDLIRLYLGRNWRPEWIEVDYPRDPDASQVEDWLGIPLRFDAPGLGIPLRRTDLLQTSRVVQQRRQNVVTLREVFADVVLADAPEPARSLSAFVALRLLDGRSDIEGAAQLAGLSVQGLQRRLRDKGFTYRDLVEMARRERAIRLLVESELPITEIAFSLGYENHESFTRAFRRWLGCAPSDYRRQRRPR